MYIIDLVWPSGSPVAPKTEAQKTPKVKEVDNVEDDSYESEKGSSKDSGSDADKKHTPHQTPELRKRRPRKD